MTPIAEMVERMFADGAPMPAIITAITAMETVTRDVTPSSRVTQRDGNRKRQQERRNRLKLERLAAEARANDGATVGVTVTRDGVTPPCDLLPSSINKEGLSKEARKVRKKEGIENSRATRMQPGMLLTEPFRQAAIDLGARAEEIPGAWAEFVDYWIGVPGSRGTKLDWLATWRNRTRDTLKRGIPRGNNNGRRTVHDAANDLIQRISTLDEPAPGSLRSREGEGVVRLLPPRRCE